VFKRQLRSLNAAFPCWSCLSYIICWIQNKLSSLSKESGVILNVSPQVTVNMYGFLNIFIWFALKNFFLWLSHLERYHVYNVMDTYSKLSSMFNKFLVKGHIQDWTIFVNIYSLKKYITVKLKCLEGPNINKYVAFSVLNVHDVQKDIFHSSDSFCI
jgi:hypothetical protein